MRSGILLLAASAASFVSGALVVTSPLTSTSCSATLPCTVSWTDDGTTPDLATIGPSKVAVCSGSISNTTCLQTVSASVNVGTNSSVTFNTEPNIGPTGQFYFIRVTSLGLKTATGSSYTAYSALFSLVGMTGDFDPLIEGLTEPSTTSAVAGATSASVVPTTQSGATTRATPTPVVSTGSSGIVTTVYGSGLGASGSASSDALPTGITSSATPLFYPGMMVSVISVTLLVTAGSVCLGALALGI